MILYQKIAKVFSKLSAKRLIYDGQKDIEHLKVEKASEGQEERLLP